MLGLDVFSSSALDPVELSFADVILCLESSDC